MILWNYGTSIKTLFKVIENGNKEIDKRIKRSKEQQDRYNIESELEWVNLATHDLLFEEGDIGESKRKGTKKKRRPREDYGKGLSGWRVLWRHLNPFTKPVNLPSIADIIMRSTVLSHRNMIEETEKLTDFKFTLDVRPYSAVDYDAYEALAEIV